MAGAAFCSHAHQNSRQARHFGKGSRAICESHWSGRTNCCVPIDFRTLRCRFRGTHEIDSERERERGRGRKRERKGGRERGRKRGRYREMRRKDTRCSEKRKKGREEMHREKQFISYSTLLATQICHPALLGHPRHPWP